MRSRRGFLRAAAALPGSAALGPAANVQASNPPMTRLRDVAEARGLRYGSHPYNYPPAFAPDFDRLIAEQCAMVAPVLNWGLISPTPAEFKAGTDGGLVSFASSRGLALTGAHLLWYEAVPGWFRSFSDPAPARAAVEAYIRLMGAQYAGATWSVNVVNEALNPSDRRSDGLRRDPFLQVLGPSYWDAAFRAAREAFPRSLLAYNDYGMEQDHGEMVAKRKALLARLDDLVRRKVPIDAVGLQSHLHLAQPFDAESFASFLREVASRGVKIIISELDVLDHGAPSAVGPRDQAVAAMYRRFLDSALSERGVAAVVTWGLSDRHTWLSPRHAPHFARPDGLPTRPLPFDAELRPKLAFEAILQAFRAAPHRDG